MVDARILEESTNQLKSATAARDFAKATIKKADAELLSKRAALAKAEVDVKVAEADLKVAESEERRLKAWVGYLTLTAPYDGVITARNANTFDFVLPNTGDPSANYRTPGLSPSGSAAAIYVVDRTDIVRIFVDVPEQDANYIHIGTKASVLAKAYRDEPIPATVTRTSWALNMKSRTLRAEIDIKNPGSQLLPGMYAYAKVIIERPGVHALPEEAVTYVERQGLLSGRTRAATRCGPRSRRGSATASGSRLPIARSRRRTRAANSGCRSTARSRCSWATCRFWPTASPCRSARRRTGRSSRARRPPPIAARRHPTPAIGTVEEASNSPVVEAKTEL